MTDVCSWMAAQLSNPDYLLKAKLPKMNRLERFSYRKARIIKYITANPGCMLAEMVEGLDLRVEMVKSVLNELDCVQVKRIKKPRNYGGKMITRTVDGYYFDE